MGYSISKFFSHQVKQRTSESAFESASVVAYFGPSDSLWMRKKPVTLMSGSFTQKIHFCGPFARKEIKVDQAADWHGTNCASTRLKWNPARAGFDK